MSHRIRTIGLNLRERELTALGAAIASNCIPCVEYHVPQARKAGLSDTQIREAIELAVKLRRIPADKVVETAVALLEEPVAGCEREGGASCSCS